MDLKPGPDLEENLQTVLHLSRFPNLYPKVDFIATGTAEGFWTTYRTIRDMNSAIDLAKYDVERTDNRGDVSEHMSAGKEFHGRQMRK